MIAFISCGKRKQNHSCKASDMYIGDYFKKNLEYAKKIADKVYILSAKYGLLHLDDIISPYEYTLVKKTERIKKIWAYKVYCQLKEENIDFNEPAIFIAGREYSSYLIQKFPNGKMPFKNMRIGKRLTFLKEAKKGDKL